MYNKDYKKLDIKTKKLVNNIFLWNYKASFKWRGLEFSDFRAYEDWDDAKHIDWLVSAREWKTIVRKYEEERELNILFLIDLKESMFFGINKKKIDILKEIFFIIWLSGVESSDKIWAILFWWEKEKIINFKKWKVSLLNILKGIESYNSSTCSDLLDLKFLNKLKIKNSLVFVLTDRLEIDKKQLYISEQKNDIIYINIFDSFENSLDKKWVFNFWDFENELNLDLDNQEMKEKYVLLRKKKINNLEDILQRKKIDYICIDERKNISKELLKLMRNRGK